MNEQNELSRKVGAAADPERTSAGIPEETQRGNNDFLKMLEAAFFTPMISLVKVYLIMSNGKGKTVENCMLDFRNKHSWVYRGMYSIDFVFRFIYLCVLFIVVLRGLGIPEYVVTVMHLK